MKRAFKIIIPLVIILAIIVSSVWFLFFNRPELTNNLLIKQAEAMSQRGRYNRAIQYFNWAWSLQPERDDIPIKLAETYAASGNYTKAEYTLVKAISDNPEMTELYASLCRIYVEQDKLLDATQMLDRITDQEVKAELDALRPEAPALSPEGGYYNEYIDVEISADDANIYFTTNGEYPSSDEDLYRLPITLPGGETSVLAIAVDRNGLVSPVVRSGYTVGGVVEEITLLDPAIDQTVREQLALSSDAALMSDLLWSITHLTLPDHVSNLSDLSKFTGLRSLTVNNISGLDFSILSQLPSLQELNLSGCTLSSGALSAIGTLSELQSLTLDGCALSDISPLSQLTKLKVLSIANNSISDIGIISLMPALESLDVSNNPLSSIAAVSASTKLKYLDITSCSVTSLGSLTDKNQLETLLASNNNIRSISELKGCRHLSVLEVTSNKISDIDVLTQFPALTRFEANHNEISSVPDFDENDCILIYFGINYNQVSDVSGLAGISTLNYLNIDYNNVTDLTSIASNANLIKINAWDNAINEESIQALTEEEVILNYNPNFEAPSDE